MMKRIFWQANIPITSEENELEVCFDCENRDKKDWFLQELEKNNLSIRCPQKTFSNMLAYCLLCLNCYALGKQKWCITDYNETRACFCSQHCLAVIRERRDMKERSHMAHPRRNLLRQITYCTIPLLASWKRNKCT